MGGEDADFEEEAMGCVSVCVYGKEGLGRKGDGRLGEV